MPILDSPADSVSAETGLEPLQRGIPSAFEKLITDQPPVLESLIAQLPTQSILALFHTSSYLNNFLKISPTSWRYISWRLYQPALTTASPTNNSSGNGPRQSSNYALDQLLLYVINPFSTRLTSLELDNTAVSGATLFQTVMVLRKDTLEHLSVRGCKNVSLKYHINPWLVMHLMAMDRPQNNKAPGYEKLALKSLYTYRCRHHRRRPYLPSSLARKESDSEPTHELVMTCHKLGIWTDTSWCTTPGPRCFRRRGYVTMRVPQDHRDVWVVYDRLWRSRNWLGPVPDNRSQTTPPVPDRKSTRDCRSWEFDEEAMNGESLATRSDGKTVPTHLRDTHRKFVEDIYCDNCSDPILERCEQCSITMHCSGCRKTLCASCAFDRPYLRNKMALTEDKNKYWWAPGCAVSPCSMQDQDLSQGPTNHGNSLPSIKFRWCCTEPIFSGGGGITFGTGQSRDQDQIRAAPLPMGQSWEDPEFVCSTSHSSGSPFTDVFGHRISRVSDGTDTAGGPGSRWPSIDTLFSTAPDSPTARLESVSSVVPRNLCDECFQGNQWKIQCKSCSMPLCLKHDVKDRLKVRICGYKDLTTERAEYRSRQKAVRLLEMFVMKRRQSKLKDASSKGLNPGEFVSKGAVMRAGLKSQDTVAQVNVESGLQTPRPRTTQFSNVLDRTDLNVIRTDVGTPLSDLEASNRPVSPRSNSTAPPSRVCSPTPSARSSSTPEPKNRSRQTHRCNTERPVWRGCQAFFCPQTRPAGDHRRRCIASMRQCGECKIFVCEQCVSGFEPPCPCKGCRLPAEERHVDMPLEATLGFFCPNCRWSRMNKQKCKRKPVSTTKKSQAKRLIRQRPKKPFDERRSHNRGATSSSAEASTRDATEGLAEFFEGLQVDDEVDSAPSVPTTAVEARETGVTEEIRELEDMGALARDLIRRIQTLRQQLGPNSPAALALPDIRMDDRGILQQTGRIPATHGNTTGVHPPPAQQPQHQRNDDDDVDDSSSGTATQ